MILLFKSGCKTGRKFMAAIRFTPKKERSGKIIIKAFFSDKGDEKARSLGYDIPDIRKCWNSSKEIAKACENAIEINIKINEWKTKFDEYRKQRLENENEFNLDEAIEHTLSHELKRKPPTKKVKCLLDFANEFYEMKTLSVDPGTHKQYKTMLEDIKGYEEYASVKLMPSDITKDFYILYGFYLIEEHDNINNTINKKIGRLITLMDWVFYEGHIDTQKYKIKFKFKGHKGGGKPISAKDMAKLEAHSPKSGYERIVLDAFLFSCYTGLRISDIKQLHSRHIKKHTDTDGEIMYIDLTQEKTIEGVSLPLNYHAVEILAKYPKSGRVFDLKAEQTANKTLKEIAKDAGIKTKVEIVYTQGVDTMKDEVPLYESISFHYGRNTYITNLLADGANPVFVQANVGHTSLKTTMGYSKQDAVRRWKETLALQNRRNG